MKEANFAQAGKEVQQNTQQQVQQTAVPISLVQVPTEYGLAFRTPEGDMSVNEYLVWLGNLLIELKKGIVG